MIAGSWTRATIQKNLRLPSNDDYCRCFLPLLNFIQIRCVMSLLLQQHVMNNICKLQTADLKIEQFRVDGINGRLMRQGDKRASLQRLKCYSYCTVPNFSADWLPVSLLARTCFESSDSLWEFTSSHTAISSSLCKFPNINTRTSGAHPSRTQVSDVETVMIRIQEAVGRCKSFPSYQGHNLGVDDIQRCRSRSSILLILSKSHREDAHLSN